MALGAVDGWEPLLLVILAAVIIGVWLAAIKAVVRKKFKTPLRKWLWIAITILIPILAALIYVF